MPPTRNCAKSAPAWSISSPSDAELASLPAPTADSRRDLIEQRKRAGFSGPFLFVTRVGSIRACQLVRFRGGLLQRRIDGVEQLFAAEWLAQEDAARGYLVVLHFIVGADHDDGDRRVALDGVFAELDAGGAAGEYDVGDENIDPGQRQVAAGTGDSLRADAAETLGARKQQVDRFQHQRVVVDDEYGFHVIPAVPSTPGSIAPVEGKSVRATGRLGFSRRVKPSPCRRAGVAAAMPVPAASPSR